MPTSMYALEHWPEGAATDTPWSVEALEAHNNATPFAAPALAACLADVLQTAPGDAPIVEVGAGLGFLGELIPDRYRARYTQTEIGEENCRIAAERNPDLATVQAAAQDLGKLAGAGIIIARNLFDVVDTEAVIAEIGRVLLPGGRAVHIRDRRPSLPWIQDTLGLGRRKRLIPDFDARTNSFQRYQVFAESVLREALGGQRVSAEALSDPHFQEHMNNGRQGSPNVEYLRLVSRLVSDRAERVTPPFTEIMDKTLAKLFRAQPFNTTSKSVIYKYSLPAGATQRSGVRPEHNTRTAYSDGYYAETFSPEVPEGTVLIEQQFDVFTALKKHTTP